MAYSDLDPISAFSQLPSTHYAQLLENVERLHDGTGFAAGALGADADSIGGSAIPSVLGITTLGTAGDTISITSMPARKHLRLMVFTTDTGGTSNITLRFNNDSSNNYAYRTSVNGGADSTSSSQSSIVLGATDSSNKFCVAEIVNMATFEKRLFAFNNQGATGASNAPGRLEIVGKWVNTAAQINRIDIVNPGTGDFAIGSVAVVVGHD